MAAVPVSRSVATTPISCIKLIRRFVSSIYPLHLFGCQYPSPPIVILKRIVTVAPFGILQSHPITPLCRPPVECRVQFLKALHEPSLPFHRHRLQEAARDCQVLRVCQIEPSMNRFRVAHGSCTSINSCCAVSTGAPAILTVGLSQFRCSARPCSLNCHLWCLRMAVLHLAQTRRERRWLGMPGARLIPMDFSNLVMSFENVDGCFFIF